MNIYIQPEGSFSAAAVLCRRRKRGKREDHKRMDGSEEFLGCAKEFKACFCLGWVGRDDWGA